MFNLPFPTDSLYKFSFMFGLVLIVYSYYFRDNHLNKFDNKQAYHILDSLEVDLNYYSNITSLDKDRMAESSTYLKGPQNPIDSEMPFSKNSIVLAANHLEDIVERCQDKKTTMLYKSIIGDTAKYDSKILFDKYKQMKSNISAIDSADYGGIAKKLKDNKEKLKEDYKSFQMLVSIGYVLFILGIIFWYLKIQKPQDELLKMQLTDARKKVDESKIIKTRKHFEPKILPRPEVRNKV